jgi:hypothetical protein
MLEVSETGGEKDMEVIIIGAIAGAAVVVARICPAICPA